MNFIFPILLTLLCCAVIYWSCANSTRIYQLPFFVVIGFLAFIVPQLFGLYVDPYPLTFGTIDLASFMSIICVTTCWVSYANIKINHINLSKINYNYSTDRLFHWGIFYSIVGNIFFALIGELDESYISTQATGLFVAYLFFARLIYPGFALIAIPTFANPTLVRVVIFLLSTLQPLVRFLVFGRRTETLVFLSIIFLSLFFIRKIVVQKRFLFPVLLIGTIFGLSIGQYRSLVTNADISLFTIEGAQQIINAVSSIDWINGLTQSSSGEKSYELKFAASAIEAVQSTGQYGFGRGYWNRLVFNFIPAQLVGEELKTSLYLPSVNVIDIVQKYFGFQTFRTGLTITCVGELFVEFWFFGCLVFWVISYAYKHLWTLANDYSNSMAQVLYCLVLPFSVVAVGAGTSNLLSQIVYYLIFLYPVFLYSKSFSRFDTSKRSKTQS
jgi:hypothetical protein